ncbi:MAG: hypothetical protein MASP_01785 [Candidatus Methanolliviera sp. GoM_asphalt]|nr:MAG: hypothetical protein MASP_01785 [Candidatus Methanolliviera sp. GoM_asphalt]
MSPPFPSPPKIAPSFIIVLATCTLPTGVSINVPSSFSTTSLKEEEVAIVVTTFSSFLFLSRKISLATIARMMSPSTNLPFSSKKTLLSASPSWAMPRSKSPLSMILCKIFKFSSVGSGSLPGKVPSGWQFNPTYPIFRLSRNLGVVRNADPLAASNAILNFLSLIFSKFFPKKRLTLSIYWLDTSVFRYLPVSLQLTFLKFSLK